jgi:aldehyde dehydrogenase (NAD+)/betaine-aldehyde dehydrogenase
VTGQTEAQTGTSGAGTPPAYTARAYIDGRWVLGEGEPFEVINPATEEVLAVVPALTTAQADEAAAAAVRAFAGGPWSKVPARQRSQLLHRLADLIERDTDRLIDLMIDEIGPSRSATSAGSPTPPPGWPPDPTRRSPRPRLRTVAPRC